MQIVPQQSRVVVEPIEGADNEIVIPDSKGEDGDIKIFKRLRVIAVGTGRVLDSGIVINIPIKAGDEVIVDTRYAFPLVPHTWYGGRELYVIDYAGVLAKVERGENEPVVQHKPPAILQARKAIIVQ